MNLLDYYPYSQVSVEQQSMMEMLVQKGHNVWLLTTCEEGYLHNCVRQFGVKAFGSPTKGGGLLRYFRYARHLIKFCKENKIDVIFAQQQSAALPALIASPFLKAKIIYVRHNSDEDYMAHPVKAKWMNRILNIFMKRLVAPSDKVLQQWVKVENTSAKKISRINYGYNFNQYKKGDPVKIKEIQEEYPCQLRIVSIARMVPAKRHILMFQTIQAAVQKGVDCKLICIGSGPDTEKLKQWVKDNNLDERIFVIGFRSNIFDYLEAAELYLHLSSSEASNSSVKEAGIAACASIVCEDVGDFSEYMVDGVNGYLLSKNPTVEEVLKPIVESSQDKVRLRQMGQVLKETILRDFAIERVAPLYDQLLIKTMQ